MDVTVLAHGQPLTNADVEGLYSAGIMRVGTVSGSTDRDGKTRLWFPVNECSILVRAKGFATASCKSKVPGIAHLTLEPAASISLRVRTEAGESPTNISIGAFSPSGSPVMKATPGAEPGTYSLEGLSPRPHRVLVMASDWQGVRLENVLPDGSIRDVILKKGGRLSGRVVDNSGNAVPRARVTASSVLGVPVNTYSDEQGRYFLENVSDGPLTLYVDAAHFLSRTIEGVHSGDQDILVKLAPGGGIEIRFEGDNVPPEVDIGLQEQHSKAFGGCYTLGVIDARVHLGPFSGLKWGTYELEIISEGFEVAKADNIVLTPEAPVATVRVLQRRTPGGG